MNIDNTADCLAARGLDASNIGLGFGTTELGGSAILRGVRDASRNLVAVRLVISLDPFANGE
jgi:ribosomal protein S5